VNEKLDKSKIRKQCNASVTEKERTSQSVSID
jgi:hypothetical protein